MISHLHALEVTILTLFTLCLTKEVIRHYLVINDQWWPCPNFLLDIFQGPISQALPVSMVHLMDVKYCGPFFIFLNGIVDHFYANHRPPDPFVYKKDPKWGPYPLNQDPSHAGMIKQDFRMLFSCF